MYRFAFSPAIDGYSERDAMLYSTVGDRLNEFEQKREMGSTGQWAMNEIKIKCVILAEL